MHSSCGTLVAQAAARVKAQSWSGKRSINVSACGLAVQQQVRTREQPRAALVGRCMAARESPTARTSQESSPALLPLPHALSFKLYWVINFMLRSTPVW